MKKTHAATFDEVLKKDDRLKVVVFHATWCKPCQNFMPLVEEMEEETFDGVDFYSLDVDGENRFMPKLYEVKEVPTMILFRDGKELTRTGPIGATNVLEEYS